MSRSAEVVEDRDGLEQEWFRSHVERRLQEIWDRKRLVQDQDGDYPFRRGSAGCWVHVELGQPPAARVVAVAAMNVKSSAGLLRELSDFNACALTARAFFCDGQVIVDQRVLAPGFNRFTLEQAIESVGQIADDVGTMLASLFGGTTMFSSDLASTERPES